MKHPFSSLVSLALLLASISSAAATNDPGTTERADGWRLGTRTAMQPARPTTTMTALTLTGNPTKTLTLPAAQTTASTTTTECKPEYSPRRWIITFANLGPYCFGGCVPWKEYNLTYERGGAWNYNLENGINVYLGSQYNWVALNCSAYPGEAKGEACSKSEYPVNSIALYSPTGSAPWDANVPMRFGNVDIGEPYNPFTVQAISLYVFAPGLDSVNFHLIGLRPDGTKTNFTKAVPANTLTRIDLVNSSLGQPTHITAFDIWFGVRGERRKYPFTIDQILWIEDVPKQDTTSCTQSKAPTGKPGPCVPKPTATMTIKADFDEFDRFAILPQHYKGINWGTDYTRIFNSSSVNDPENGGRRDLLVPGKPIPPSGRNFILHETDLTIHSDNYENRFGLEEVYVICKFWSYQEAPHLYGLPCVVTFQGRRDPLDGSGLPTLVEGTISIPSPLADLSDRNFTRVKLADITKDKNAFRRLVRLDIFTDIAGADSNGHYWSNRVHSAFDSFVFTRELGEGEACRIKGDVLNFDDLPANSVIPTLYKNYAFPVNELFPFLDRRVTSRSSYPPGSAGYLSVISPENSLYIPNEIYFTPLPVIDSSIPPSQLPNAYLFDFISATLTFDIDPTNQTAIENLELTIQVDDACGQTSLTESLPRNVRPLKLFYESTLLPKKVQLRFARPYTAISRIRFSARVRAYDGPNWDSDWIGIWVDDVEVRRSDVVMPGCVRCAFRGYGLCEWPILGR